MPVYYCRGPGCHVGRGEEEITSSAGSRRSGYRVGSALSGLAVHSTARKRQRVPEEEHLHPSIRMILAKGAAAGNERVVSDPVRSVE